MLIRIAAAIFMTIYLIEVVGLDMLIKRKFKITGRLKPIDCHECLAAWLGLGFYFAPLEWAIMSLCFFGSGYLVKYLHD
jgi:hypothetical protein